MLHRRNLACLLTGEGWRRRRPLFNALISLRAEVMSVTSISGFEILGPIYVCFRQYAYDGATVGPRVVRADMCYCANDQRLLPSLLAMMA